MSNGLSSGVSGPIQLSSDSQRQISATTSIAPMGTAPGSAGADPSQQEGLFAVKVVNGKVQAFVDHSSIVTNGLLGRYT